MKIEEIDVNKIDVEENIRINVDRENLASLMSSIKQNGLLQPIGVYKKNSRYSLIWGQRRLKACKKLGWNTIDAIVTPDEMTEEDFIIKNTIENLQRKDNTPYELGRVCHILIENGMRLQEIASRLDASFNKVQTALKIYQNLPEKMRTKVDYTFGKKKTGKISASDINIALSLRTKKQNIEKVLESLESGKIQTSELRTISEMTNSGIPFEKAMQLKDEYRLSNVRIVFHRKGLEEQMKSANIESTSEYLKKCLLGEMEFDKNLIPY